MNKAFHNLILIAATASGLSLAVASCADDKELSDQEKQQQIEQQSETDLNQAAEFWNVVGQLTDDPMPDDWQHATYAPSIGEPDGESTTVRIVSTADAETAAARFAQLTGANINENTQDYTYQNDVVGTLKYHRTGGTSLATVDVDIKLMPGLTQIIYQSPEQMGSNSSFNGTAYYRFGDVVKKINSDGVYEYWICVRPAFGPAGKGDSHWISVSKIPSANTKQVTKIINKEKITHSLPKSLSTNREHMQNLAEMLYAMTNPQQWASNLSTNDGYKTLKYFRDFDYKKLFSYNDDSFFFNVSYNWEQRNLFQTLFGLNREQMKAVLNTTGLNLVYSSATMSGNKILLPIANYNGTNLKTEKLSKTNSEWTTQFDIIQLMKSGYISYTDAVGTDQKAWLIRYATGATLCKGSLETSSFDKFKKLTNCEDVFVYNRDVLQLSMKDKDLKNISPGTFGKATEPGYYTTGDIIRYQNRYYVCVSKHGKNGTSRFITLNDQESHTTGTCTWSGYGDDIVYNDEMASSETLAAWIQNILMDDIRWTEIVGAMQDRGLSNYTLQLVPQDKVLRQDFVSGLFHHSSIIPEFYLQDPLNNYTIPVTSYIFTYLPSVNQNKGISCGIAEKLLADKFRWTYYAIGSNEYWVPYIVCVRDKNFAEISQRLNEVSSQSSSHFQWKILAENVNMNSQELVNDIVKEGKYNIILLAMHWEHTTFFEVDYNYYALLDFTKDWCNHPDNFSRMRFEQNPDLWGRRCITSRELLFQDTGSKNPNCQSVWVVTER